VILLLATTTFAQTNVDFDDLKSDIESFAAGVASSLPLNAAVGLNWSDAYIGQFPHFGIGLTVGASTIPYRAAEFVLDTIGLADGIKDNPEFRYIEQFGVPLPAYTAEARIGGFIIPFDLGVKVGILPPDFNPGDLIPGFTLEYTNIGFDVRLPIVEERAIIPEVSVGGGYNYLRANVGFAGILGNDLNIADFADPRPDVDTVYSVSMTDPSVNYQWSANVIDLKAQVSKSLLLFRPFVGVGASIGFGSAGAGFESDLTGIDSEDIEAINTWAEAQGLDSPLPSLSSKSFYVNASMGNGWAFRAFGGLGIDLLIVKIDITGMYDFLGANYGVTLGARVQL
jgi:hypothetical protein